jgi:branched-chain amino acid transport system substrate-binding protein
MKRINHKSSAILAVISILIASLMVFSFGCAKKEEKEIKIGAILPLTGDAAEWGNNTKNGIDIAVDKINNAGGINGKKIKILYEDTQGTPQNGVSAIQKLIDIEKVPAIIDDSMSSVTLAMAPIAEKNKVVLLSTGATAPKISEAGDYIFRIWNSDDLEGKISANFVKNELKFRNAAILYINNDYGKGLEGVFKKEFENLGGKILISENFGQSDTDYKTQLTKIKNMKPEVIYLVGYPKEISLILKQASELRVNSKIIGTVTFEDPNIIRLAGKAAEGVIYPYPVEPNKSDKAVSEFLNSYKAKYSKDPGITCDVGYDAVNMIAEAVRLSKGFKGEDVQRGLMMIKDFHGASGVMTFDKNGDVSKPIEMKTIKNGKFSWLKDGKN